MNIGWINHFDLETNSNLVVTVGSAEDNYPASNLTNPHVSRFWRSTAGATTGHILASYPSSVAVKGIAILGTNLKSTATMRIRASNSDVTATTGDLFDSGTISANASSDYESLYYILSTAVTAQYWRIDLINSTLSTYLRAGRIFMGPMWTPTKGMLYGWSVSDVDNSRQMETYGGQTYSDRRFKKRRLQFTLSFMDEAEMYDNTFEMDRRNGITKEVLVIPNSDGDYVHEQSVYGFLRGVRPLSHSTLDIYLKRFDILERL